MRLNHSNGIFQLAGHSGIRVQEVVSSLCASEALINKERDSKCNAGGSFRRGFRETMNTAWH